MESPLNARAVLLSMLMDGKGYGLDLIDRARKRTRGKVTLNEGSVYPALRAMEEEGLLKSFPSEPIPERGGRPRRYYELTAEGRRVARDHAKTAFALLPPPAVVR